MNIKKSSIQFSRSLMSDSLKPHRLQHARPSLSITNSQSLLKLMSIESVMPSNHPILCGPLLLLHSIFPSIRVFSNESVLLIRWPRYWQEGLITVPDWRTLFCTLSRQTLNTHNVQVFKKAFSHIYLIYLSCPNASPQLPPSYYPVLFLS